MECNLSDWIEEQIALEVYCAPVRDMQNARSGNWPVGERGNEREMRSLNGMGSRCRAREKDSLGSIDAYHADVGEMLRC